MCSSLQSQYDISSLMLHVDYRMRLVETNNTEKWAYSYNSIHPWQTLSSFVMILYTIFLRFLESMDTYLQIWYSWSLIPIFYHKPVNYLFSGILVYNLLSQFMEFTHRRLLSIRFPKNHPNQPFFAKSCV
jgi:hypothetical protein